MGMRLGLGLHLTDLYNRVLGPGTGRLQWSGPAACSLYALAATGALAYSGPAPTASQLAQASSPTVAAMSYTGPAPSIEFLPSDLFASGEDGGWYDPSDLTSMTVYRSNVAIGAGTDIDLITNPAVGDTVGTVFDKSQLGGQTVQGYFNAASNLIDVNEFDDGGGLGPATAVISGSQVTVSAVPSLQSVSVAFTTVVGETYMFQGQMTSSTDNGWIIKSDASGDYTTNRVDIIQQEPADASATAIHSFVATATTTYLHLLNGGAGNSETVFDNLKIVNIPGNHLVAPSDAARPVLQTSVPNGTSATTTGSELVTNGTFPTDMTGWTDGSGVSSSVVSGQANVTGTGGAGNPNQYTYQEISGLTQNGWYKFSYNYVTKASGGRMFLGSVIGSSVYYGGSNPGTYTALVQPTAGTSIFISLGDSADAAVTNIYDDISILEVDSSEIKYYLDFDGADDVLAADVSDLGDVTTISAAATVPTVSNDRILQISNKTTETNARILFFYNGSSSVLFCGDSGTTAANIGSGNTAGSLYVHVGQGKTNDFEYWIDGVSEGTDTSGNFGTSSLNYLTLGAMWQTSQSFTNWGDTDVYGSVVINRELTAQERSDLETFLADKSGVTLP